VLDLWGAAIVRSAAAALPLTVLLLAACVNRPAPASNAAGGSRFILDLTPGSAYHAPQVAAWVETEEGRYVGTLFVTAKTARGAWIFAPKTGRPEALPVWSYARGTGADAVSSATPSGPAVLDSSLADTLPAGSYVVRLEVNRSFDYNERYTKAQGVNGQPSLVYRAVLRVGGGRDEASFEFVGTGSPDGSDGSVAPGSNGTTTALDIYSFMRIAYEPR